MNINFFTGGMVLLAGLGTAVGIIANTEVGIILSTHLGTIFPWFSTHKEWAARGIAIVLALVAIIYLPIYMSSRDDGVEQIEDIGGATISTFNSIWLWIIAICLILVLCERFC